MGFLAMKYFYRFALILICGLFLSACGSEIFLSWSTHTPTSTPTAIPTATPTFTVTPTNTLIPTPTATSTPIPPTPTATMTLKEQSELKLYLASLRFIAETPEEADEVARRINYATDPHESADGMCGPLTVAILKAAGYLPPDVPEKPMWLLCPREEIPGCTGLDKLNQYYFPVEDYDYIMVNESVGTFDFASNPLQPGDWLYLFAHPGISKFDGFDHMLVVTRVDDDEAAYTVTNINFGQGFIISEEMLYHPELPKIGLFADLTNDELRQDLGMTGNQGFLLIRAKNP